VKHTILRGGLLLDIVGRKASHADILIEDDTVREIGPADMSAPLKATIIDATDRLIIPGLINAHTHGHGSLGKGLGDKWSLELLLNAAPWATGGFSLEDKKTAALLNAVEMVKKGCTAAYDMYFEFPTASSEGMGAIADAYAEVGLRVQLAPMMADTPLYQAIPGLLDAIPEPHRAEVARLQAASPQDHLSACRTILQNWRHSYESVRPALGPTIPLHCSDDFITGCRDLARDYDIGIQMHLAESKVQAVAGVARYGKTLTAHIHNLGLLGPNFTGAHGVWLDEDDIARLSDNGASIAHNPGSNMRLGSGIAPARRMLNGGVNFGVGTDGSVSSDNQNMFEAMRMAAFASRVVSPDPDDWLGTWDVLEAATLGGAKVMGMQDQIGQIAPGFKADVVLLDLDNVNFVPLNNAANQIVNCEDSSAVSSVMIGGRMVMQDRKLLGIDYVRLREKVAAATARLSEANADTKARMDMLAPFVSAHCVGLACQHYHVRSAVH
jgi:5-methylthioadenosine/S-adenosylhomocysteine deaminase